MGKLTTFLAGLALGYAALNVPLGNTAQAQTIPVSMESAGKVEEEDELEKTVVLPERKVKFTPTVGFGYRRLAVGDDLEAYVDKTRYNFDPAMPGFKDFMQLGHQLPYLSIGLEVEPQQWHFWQGDTISLLAQFDFSTSKIFGGTKDSHTYDASLSALKLGPTPSTWEQNLTFYGAGTFGVKYAPVSVGNDKFKFKPLIVLKGGFSYLDSKSVLHIHVDNDLKGMEPITWEVLNSLNVYRDIRTDATTSGWGGFFDAMAGFGIETYGFVLDALVSYRVERINLKIQERTVSDGKLETKDAAVSYKADGLNVLVTAGYKF
ncbi:MAG: hypothetical protein V2A62_00530 [Candidatus Woesearchaeota archaeon]